MNDWVDTKQIYRNWRRHKLQLDFDARTKVGYTCR